MYDAIFVTPWPWWAAGGAIGLFVITMALVTGKMLGVSSGYGSACGWVSGLKAWKEKPFCEGWRTWFLAGLPLGGLAAAALAGGPHVVTALQAFGDSPALTGAAAFSGGALIGLGARWAGGCTSGHSIVGIALGSKGSLVATLGFMAAGFGVTQLLFRVFGVA
ncbi:MAG: YeeE/YedE family protein [Planctomycetia bacterium]|nr:YeeE/YedE family protein [Planctomycetia bacterium]